MDKQKTQPMNAYIVQVLKSEHVSGRTQAGRDYSFYRHSCLVKTQSGAVIEIGDLTTDNELPPGDYSAGFQIDSYQGKLSAKIIPLPLTSLSGSRTSPA